MRQVLPVPGEPAMKKCKGMCRGPCYDFCMCSHCWWGWSQLPWWRKIVWRLQYLLQGEES